jgi:Ca-activated chloride channel family protein
MFLAGINTSMVSRQGTDIGSAIELAIRSFGKKTTAGRAIIIISDGENHEGNVEEACEKAAESGIRIYTIGMGLPQGERIPLNENEYNRDFRRDNEGNFVVTRLNEQMLADIAASGGGKYYRANSPNMGLGNLLSHLDQLDKVEMEYRVYTEFEEQFPALVWIAFGLLVFEFILIDRKNRWFRIRLFD